MLAGAQTSLVAAQAASFLARHRCCEESIKIRGAAGSAQCCGRQVGWSSSAIQPSESPCEFRSIAKRFAKKQQMQWFTAGTYLLLQTCTRTLDGTLRKTFRKWYPAMAANDTQTPTVAA
jgi:hypothetical protein